MRPWRRYFDDAGDWENCEPQSEDIMTVTRALQPGTFIFGDAVRYEEDFAEKFDTDQETLLTIFETEKTKFKTIDRLNQNFHEDNVENYWTRKPCESTFCLFFQNGEEHYSSADHKFVIRLIRCPFDEMLQIIDKTECMLSQILSDHRGLGVQRKSVESQQSEQHKHSIMHHDKKLRDEREKKRQEDRSLYFNQLRKAYRMNDRPVPNDERLLKMYKKYKETEEQRSERKEDEYAEQEYIDAGYSSEMEYVDDPFCLVHLNRKAFDNPTVDTWNRALFSLRLFDRGILRCGAFWHAVFANLDDEALAIAATADFNVVRKNLDERSGSDIPVVIPAFVTGKILWICKGMVQGAYEPPGVKPRLDWFNNIWDVRMQDQTRLELLKRKKRANLFKLDHDFTLHVDDENESCDDLELIDEKMNGSICLNPFSFDDFALVAAGYQYERRFAASSTKTFESGKHLPLSQTDAALILRGYFTRYFTVWRCVKGIWKPYSNSTPWHDIGHFVEIFSEQVQAIVNASVPLFPNIHQARAKSADLPDPVPDAENPVIPKETRQKEEFKTCYNYLAMEDLNIADFLAGKHDEEEGGRRYAISDGERFLCMGADDMFYLLKDTLQMRVKCDVSERIIPHESMMVSRITMPNGAEFWVLSTDIKNCLRSQYSMFVLRKTAVKYQTTASVAYALDPDNYNQAHEAEGAHATHCQAGTGIAVYRLMPIRL